MTSPKIQIVATPIGNLGDISFRAVEVLRASTVIACEDTRRTSVLLRHLGIDRPRLVVLNDHTERNVVERLVADAVEGARVALVSDAGMPAISDPGWLLVTAAIAGGVDLEVIPGASASLAGLVLSGLPTDRFAFDGFLPRKGAERATRLAEVAAERRTVVLYEAPHRLERTLVDLMGACGPDRRVAVARELTKLYEEVVRGPIAEVVQWARDSSPRGEMVIVIDGAPETVTGDDAIRVLLAEEFDAGATLRGAVDEVARVTGSRRRLVYGIALELRGDDEQDDDEQDDDEQDDDGAGDASARRGVIQDAVDE